METGAQKKKTTVAPVLGFGRGVQMFVTAFVPLTPAKHVEARDGALARGEEERPKRMTRGRPEGGTAIAMATESTNVWFLKEAT